jgi:hypothetical protein
MIMEDWARAGHIAMIIAGRGGLGHPGSGGGLPLAPVAVIAVIMILSR